jgi:hypothetical protein
MKNALLVFLVTLTFSLQASQSLACIPKPGSFDARSCSSVSLDDSVSQLCFGRIASPAVVSYDFISVKTAEITYVYRVQNEKTIPQKADGTIVSVMSVVRYGTIGSDGVVKVVGTSRPAPNHSLTITRNSNRPSNDSVKGSLGTLSVYVKDFKAVPRKRGC